MNLGTGRDRRVQRECALSQNNITGVEPHYYERRWTEFLLRAVGRAVMDMDVDGHRKFGIIAPLNFAIISSGQTDGEREGWVFRDSLMISYQARYYSMTDHLVDE